jgi:hypothetical protein
MKKLVIAFLLSFPVLATAQDADSSKKKPDYSKKAILQMLQEEMDEDGNLPLSPFDVGFRYETRTTKFRWVPFVMPFLVNAGGDVSLAPYVDPFVLTGTSFPVTPATARDWLSDWRTRRFLRKNVEAANRRDND